MMVKIVPMTRAGLEESKGNFGEGHVMARMKVSCKPRMGVPCFLATFSLGRVEAGLPGGQLVQ